MKQKGKVALLSMQPHHQPIDNENLVRLPEELGHFGYEADVLFFDKFFLGLGKSRQPIFFYDEKPFKVSKYKLYILIMAGSKGNGFIAEALESAGALTKNSYASIAIAKDKLRTYLFLTRAGIPTLPAAVNFSEYFLGPMLDYFKDEKYICKLIRGSLGKGVAIIESKLSLISMLELLASADIMPSGVMFEQFVAEAAGRDIRVIATPKRVIAAMERRSNGFDFRANIFGGGKGFVKKLTPKMEKIACGSIKALGLDYGGVDILETKKGPVVIEVNANPGLKIENHIGFNVPREIARELVKGI
jgi:ribosomal protein S6--L-glutamate ligase